MDEARDGKSRWRAAWQAFKSVRSWVRLAAGGTPVETGSSAPRVTPRGWWNWQIKEGDRVINLTHGPDGGTTAEGRLRVGISSMYGREH